MQNHQTGVFFLNVTMVFFRSIPGHGIFFMGVDRPNFGRGGQFFCEGEGSNFFAKKGGKGVGKNFFAKNFLSLPVFLQS